VGGRRPAPLLAQQGPPLTAPGPAPHTPAVMFPGFVAADLDCYLPHKWKSNVFNRERMEVKQKLLGLAREVGVALTASDGSPLFIETSVEHPALWNHKQ